MKNDEMLEEYDFSKGIRGKYTQAYNDGVNIIKLDNVMAWENFVKELAYPKPATKELKALMNMKGFDD